jgi:hypothetical protein
MLAISFFVFNQRRVHFHVPLWSFPSREYALADLSGIFLPGEYGLTGTWSSPLSLRKPPCLSVQRLGARISVFECSVT